MQDKLILTVLRYICQLREAHTRQLISYNIVIIGFFNWIKSNYIYVNLGQLIQDRFRINCNYWFFFWGIKSNYTTYITFKMDEKSIPYNS